MTGAIYAPTDDPRCERLDGSRMPLIPESCAKCMPMTCRRQRAILAFYARQVTEVQPQYQISSIFAAQAGVHVTRVETPTIRTVR